MQRNQDKRPFEYRAVDSITPNPRNARSHSKEQIAAIAGSIKQFGFNVPLVVDGEGVLVSGHGRLAAARKLGMQSVPCVVINDLSDVELRAFMLADNRIAELSDWDAELLANEISGLSGAELDLAELGLGEDWLRSYQVNDILGDDLDPQEVDNQDYSPPDEPRTKVGDVITLGRHRLICGDCTEEAVVSLAMAGKMAHICWTDPPWNVDYGADQDHPSWKPRKILNDNLRAAFPGFVAAFVENIKSALIPGGILYLAMSAQEWPVIHAGLTEAGFHWSSTIIWAKDSLVLSRKDYHTQYEPIWYGWLGGSPRVCKVEDRKQSDLWQIPRPKRSDEHPTMKPVELVARSLKNSSRPGDIVFEPFAGSGTTLLAAETTRRICHAVEMDPKYCDVIVSRWEDLTGQEAVYNG